MKDSEKPSENMFPDEKKRKRRTGLLIQVAILFLIGTALLGCITFISHTMSSNKNTAEEMEDIAGKTADEISAAVNEYPAHKWLFEYWYKNADKLDIEYDVEYSKGTKTREKAERLEKKYPGLQLEYADESDVKKLSDDDQKLYAEVIYSWVITRLNQIKRAQKTDFLFVILTNDLCEKQFFLLSAADPGAERGMKYGQVYPIGKISDVNENQIEAMKAAKKYSRHLADAGAYVDYYYYMGKVGDQDLLIGVTYSMEGMNSRITRDAAARTVTSMTFLGILALICLLLIYFFVIRPVKTIQQSIRGYTETKESDALKKELSTVTPNNEIGDLSVDTISLAEAMDDYNSRIQTVTAEKERIETELTLAERIQGSMLPSTFPPYPERSEFDINASMDPAREVGGDFYDFFLIDDDHLGMVMADVSGKGIPAALFMMASKILIKNFAMLGIEPEEVITKTNNSLYNDNKVDMFVTVWLGVLDIRTGKVKAVNAGHEYPAIRKSGGDFEILKDKHGFVVGGMGGIRYKQYEFELGPGSSLFLYTDGVPEATNGDNELFGTDRMLEALNMSKDGDPGSILKNVRKEVDLFVKDAEQFDDLTMLSLRYNGTGK